MHKRFKRAFTVVELLIVVVVIGILATLVAIAYDSAIGDANETSLKHDLTSAASDLESYRIDNNGYPGSDEDIDFSASGDNQITYYNVGEWYCVAGSMSGDDALSLYLTSDSKSIEEGDCPVPEITANTLIQQVAKSQCNNLTTYTGSNESATRTVRDTRGGITRNYRIAKLADNNCWMLDNLRLGSTTGSITLTPSDSNVSSNFTLPQLITSGTISYDNPRVIGPVTGDGAGATNYGYLYNWPAATAGETQTSFPSNSSNAPHSICPANWRLPAGNNTGKFAMLNAKMNNPNATAPSTSGGAGFRENWQYTGPFKGVFAGYWNGSFVGQGSNGYLWSSSTPVSGSNYAQYVSFAASSVSPGSDSYLRSGALSVRCILN